MLTIESVTKLGFEYDYSKTWGGIQSSELKDVECFMLNLTDENTNSNLRLAKTFCYLMIDKEGIIDLEVDETRVAYGFYLEDSDELKQLLFLCGINAT